MERSNIIGMPNCNYLIRSNSWNEWIFEINNHSNLLNGQVLLKFIFSCYNVSHSYYQLLPMERYVAATESSIRLKRVDSGIAFHIHFSSVSQSKRLNSLDRWPTVVLLLSMLHTYKNSHGESVGQPGSRFTTAGDNLFDNLRRMFTPGSLHSIH